MASTAIVERPDAAPHGADVRGTSLLLDGRAAAGTASAARSRTASAARSATEVRAGVGTAPARPPRSRAGLLFAVSFVAYSGLGLVLMLGFDYHVVDGFARTSNAGYVLFSRDPHLSAIGFVWNPLPSLAELPILLLRGVWPALLTRGAAGAIMAGAFMAGAVVTVRGIMADRGVARGWRWGIVAAFACSPMVILYGGDGLSEASYLFLSLWAVRRLIRWLHSDDVIDLVVAGVALGIDFLTRYETVALALGAGTFVCVVTMQRAQAARPLPTRDRLGRGLVDAALVTTPFALSFVGWAVVGWVITGSAFSQFSSVYGNSSQNSSAVTASVAPSMLTALSTAVSNVLAVEMLFPVAVLLALYLAIRRQDWDFVAACCVLGSGVAFVAAVYVMGSTIENIRYYVLEVPLTILAAGMLPARGNSSARHPRSRRAGPRASATRTPTRADLAPRAATRSAGRAASGGEAAWVALRARVARWEGWGQRMVRPLLPLVAVVLVVPAMPVLWHNMNNPSVDASDYGIRSVLHPAQYPPQADSQIETVLSGIAVSNYIDTLHLPPSSVLVDTWQGFPVVTTADNMKQFVITSDLDFVACLNDPWSCGVRYLLVPQPIGIGNLDALNRRYPTLWKTGAGFAKLVLSFPATLEGMASWRLYQLLPRTTEAA